jgi:hypothetical protein
VYGSDKIPGKQLFGPKMVKHTPQVKKMWISECRILQRIHRFYRIGDDNNILYC